MDDRIIKLNELLENGQGDLIFVDSIEETQRNLLKNGMDFSLEELRELAKTINANGTDGELNENLLEGISGGAALWWSILKHVLIPTGPIKRWR